MGITETQARNTSGVGPSLAALSLGLALLAVMIINLLAGGEGSHWWANFIVVPGALVAAVGGPLLLRGRGWGFAGYTLACIGVLVVVVGVLLMVGRMGRGWPLMITLPALAVAGTYLWHAAHPVARALHRTIACLALAGALVGLTFFALRAGLDLGDRWWAGYLILAGVIVLLNAVELPRLRIRYGLQAATLLAGPAVVAILLGYRFLRDGLPT